MNFHCRFGQRPKNSVMKPSYSFVPRYLCGESMRNGYIQSMTTPDNHPTRRPSSFRRVAPPCFRNFHYFRIAAYLKAGRLNLQIPHPLPT